MKVQEPAATVKSRDANSWKIPSSGTDSEGAGTAEALDDAAFSINEHDHKDTVALATMSVEENVKRLQNRHDECARLLDPGSRLWTHHLSVTQRVRRIKEEYGADSNKEQRDRFGVLQSFSEEEDRSDVSARLFSPAGMDPVTYGRWDTFKTYTEDDVIILEHIVRRMERLCEIVTKHERLCAQMAANQLHHSRYAYEMQIECRDLYEEQINRLKCHKGKDARYFNENPQGWEAKRLERAKAIFDEMTQEPSLPHASESIFYRPEGGINAPGYLQGGRYRQERLASERLTAIKELQERECFKARKLAFAFRSEAERTKRAQDLAHMRSGGYAAKAFNLQADQARRNRENQEKKLDETMSWEARRRVSISQKGPNTWGTGILVGTSEGAKPRIKEKDLGHKPADAREQRGGLPIEDLLQQ
jgi:hypothetical protein